MFTLYSGKSADEVWRAALADFKGTNLEWVNGRGGRTKEVLHAALSIKNPRQRWIGSRSPALNPGFALAEIVWIVCGRRDLAFLSHWNSRYGNYTGNTPQLYGAYGYRLRESNGIDQLERAYEALKSDPTSRQVVLQIWNAVSDMPQEDGTAQSGDIPCNVLSLLKVRGGKLEWTQIIRSNDMFLGVPHNVVQFTALQEIMAGWLEIDVGSYNQISDSLHVYERTVDDLKASPAEPVPDSTDDLRLDYAESGAVWGELEARAEAIIKSQSSDDLWDAGRWDEGPPAYQNILSVLAAESARRRKWDSAMTESIKRCDNPAYLHLWERWAKRTLSAPESP